MPKSHPSFTFRPPMDVLAALEVKAKTTGKGRSALVIDALRLFLDQPEPDGSITTTDLKRLTDRLDALEGHVKALMAAHSSDKNGQPRQSRKKASLTAQGVMANIKASMPPTSVTSLAEVIAILLEAYDSVKYNNAGPGLQGIKRVAPFIQSVEAIPSTTKEQILVLLCPTEPFKRNKGGPVKSAISKALELLKEKPTF